MPLLVGQADSTGLKGADTFAPCVADTGVDDTVRSGIANLSGIALRNGIGNGVETLGALWFRQGPHVIEVLRNGPHKDPQIFPARRIVTA